MPIISIIIIKPNQRCRSYVKHIYKKNTGYTNLYVHLSEVLLKILEEKPQDALMAFEEISSTIKGARYQDTAAESVSEKDTEVVRMREREVGKE